MKKLLLKKEVVARITKSEMTYLKGGYDSGTGFPTGGSILSCQLEDCTIEFTKAPTCQNTCNQQTCNQDTCFMTCQNTCSDTCKVTCIQTCVDC